jgi:hypothetical protein
MAPFMFFRRLFDPASSTLTYLIADDASHALKQASEREAR